jgi:hypothetical protein
MKLNGTDYSRLLAAWMLILMRSHCVAALDPDPPSPQVRWLGNALRRLQHSCSVPDDDVYTATKNLDTEVGVEIAGCFSPPCAIALDETQAYSELMTACQAAGGVFYEVALEITCPALSIQFTNWPLCWESQDVSSACTPDSAEGALELGMDVEGCTNTASLTGTTDFSGSGVTDPVPTDPPVSTVTIPTDPPASTGSVPTDPPASSPSDSSSGSCIVTSNSLETARSVLDSELALEIAACFTYPCLIDVSSTQGYTEMMDGCEAAGGAFHVVSMSLSCFAFAVEYFGYPECFVSESQDSSCSTDRLEDGWEIAWDTDDCSETATHTGTIDFSDGSSPAGDDPDTIAPTAAVSSAQGPEASKPTSSRDGPGATVLIPASRAWNVIAQTNSGMIFLATFLP